MSIVCRKPFGRLRSEREGKRKEWWEEEVGCGNALREERQFDCQFEPEIAELIEKDSLICKLWVECKESLNDIKHVMYFFLFFYSHNLKLFFFQKFVSTV